MQEKHWDKVKIALTHYRGVISRFKEKVKEEGAEKDFFGDLNEELTLISEGLEIAERKGSFTPKYGQLFGRALARYKEDLLKVRDQINELFPNLGKGKVNRQLELIEETEKEL